MKRFNRRAVLQKLEQYETKFKELAGQLDELRSKNEEILSAQTKLRRALEVVRSASSKNFTSFFVNRLRDMEEGTLTLTASDYYQFWTDLHIKDEICFLKVASRILPSYWNEPEMRLYEQRQIEGIKSYGRKDNASRFGDLILQTISEYLEKAETEYRYSKITNGLMKKRFEKFIDNAFERIFIIDPDWPEEEIDTLAGVIARQLSGGINVRVIAMKMNETSTFERPQDFGIVVTSTGDVFAMFCDVDIKGNPKGGLVIKDKNKIYHYLDCYLKIRGKTAVIEDSKNVRKVIDEVIENPVDISDSEIYRNRCFLCLKRAETMVTSGKWVEEESPLRTWYQILQDEQEALAKFLKEFQPESILELGCGPGRVINLILSLAKKGEIKMPKRIVGYEQNNEIAGYCMDTFVGVGNVTIYTHLLGFKPDGSFSQIRAKDRGTFHLITAVSNLVGWQDEKEAEWIANVVRDGLKTGGVLYCTVYKKGQELERARMYKAAGDIIYLDEMTSDIIIVTDAFNGEKHKSKSYKKEDLEVLLAKVREDIEIDYDISDIGKFMYEIKVKRLGV